MDNLPKEDKSQNNQSGQAGDIYSNQPGGEYGDATQLTPEGYTQEPVFAPEQTPTGTETGAPPSYNPAQALPDEQQPLPPPPSFEEDKKRKFLILVGAVIILIILFLLGTFVVLLLFP